MPYIGIRNGSAPLSRITVLYILSGSEWVPVDSSQNQLAPTNSPHIYANSPQPTRPTFIPTRPTYMPARNQPNRPTLYQLAPHLYQLAPPISLQLQIRIL